MGHVFWGWQVVAVQWVVCTHRRPSYDSHWNDDNDRASTGKRKTTDKLLANAFRREMFRVWCCHVCAVVDSVRRWVERLTKCWPEDFLWFTTWNHIHNASSSIPFGFPCRFCWFFNKPLLVRRMLWRCPLHVTQSGEGLAGFAGKWECRVEKTKKEQLSGRQENEQHIN